MNKKIKIIIIIVLILFISIGSTIAFLHENKTEKTDDLLLIRCQDNSCETNDETTTKKISTSTTSTTTQVVTTSEITTTTVQVQQSNSKPSASLSNEQGNNTTNSNVTIVEENTGITSSTEQHIAYTPTSDDDVVMHGDDTIEVKDDYQTWNQNTTIKLLKPGEFLVPGKHGSYDFSVDNIVDEVVTYMANFSEDNHFNANILFKLKRNDEYIAGNDDEWVKYDAMNFKGRTLAPGETDNYHLEWAWIDSPNDSEVGHSENPTYSFGMYVMAYEEIDYVPEYLGQGDGDAEEEVGTFFGLLNPKTGDEIYIYMTLVFMSIIGLIAVKHYRGN